MDKPIIFLAHARERMQDRGITERMVERVMYDHEKEFPTSLGRRVRRSKIEGHKAHLEAVYKEVDGKYLIVTVYWV